MPASVLQQIHFVAIGPGGAAVLAHSLTDGLFPLVPNVIFADRSTAIRVSSADDVQVEYVNDDTVNAQVAIFLVQFDHTVQQAEVAPGNPPFQFYGQGAQGIAGLAGAWSPQFVVGPDAINAGIGDLVLADETAGIVTVNLPAVSPANEGMQIAIKNDTDNTNFAINLVPAGADTIEDVAGSTPLTSAARAAWVIASDGVSNWVIVRKYPSTVTNPFVFNWSTAISGTISDFFPLGIAPSGMEIEQVTIGTSSTTASNDGNYWQIQLYNETQGVEIARWDTAPSIDGNLVRGTNYSMRLGTVDITAGDVLSIRFTRINLAISISPAFSIAGVFV